jgi:hypothetical protein
MSGTLDLALKESVYTDNVVSVEILLITYGCRCNERLKDKTEGSTHLVYTGFHGGLGHLRIETRLRGERFESVMGECVI